MRHSSSLTLVSWLAAAMLAPLAAQAPQSLPPALTEAQLRDAATAARDGLGQAPQRVLFDQPDATGPLWAVGKAWKASFDGTGSTVIPFFGTHAPQNFPLRVELQAATLDGEPLALQAGEPTQVGDAVLTARGALTERIDTHLDRLEQSFVFDQLPRRGALRVDVALRGDYDVATIEGGLRLANAWGHVDYTKAIAVDAAGERLALPITWDGDSAHIGIPADFVARAQLPLVLDPLLNYWFLLASGQTQLQQKPDVASFQALGGRTLLVWRRQWSSTDQDVYGLMFDGNLGLVAADFPIDVTTEDWLKIAIAGNNYAQNFLLVGEVRIGLQWFIAGRTIAANSVRNPVFPIEREGTVGIPGNNYHPDVGSDPYFGVGRYTVVFQKDSGSAADIYMKQVTTAGGLVTTNPVGLGVSGVADLRPSISKSCGQANGQETWWLVTWQHAFLPWDDDIWGRFVNWNGAVVSNYFVVAAPSSFESAPSAGSPIDANGARYWPVCYETASASGQPRDVACRLIRQDTGVQAVFTVSNNVPGADDYEPEIDSDGTRFVTTLTTLGSSGNRAVQAVTTAWLPDSNTFRIEERTGMNNSSLETYEHTNICADYSGGNLRTPRYMVCFAERTSNTFRLAAYQGSDGGSSGFTTRAMQCGSTTIAATGSSVIGQSITVTVNGPGYTGILFGFPGISFFGSCACLLGVTQPITMPNPMNWAVPNLPGFVGVPLSVQGFSLSGSSCFSSIDLSNTLDFTLR